MYPMEIEKKKKRRVNRSKTELVITLNVKAAELYGLPYPPLRNELNKYCRLIDTNPIAEHTEGPIEYFESIVERGQQIKWKGRPEKSKGEFTVAIESIVYAYYKPNELDGARKENFFDAIAICSTKGKTVRAKIKEDIPPGKSVNIYNINFSIKKEKGETKRYTIDPRLKITK